MTHPVSEIVAVFAVVAAIGAGTVLVLPRPKPAPAQTVVLDVGTGRLTPVTRQSDAERILALERELAAIGDEQRRIVADLRAALVSRKGEGGRK
jgi:hypothetical protein